MGIKCFSPIIKLKASVSVRRENIWCVSGVGIHNDTQKSGCTCADTPALRRAGAGEGTSAPEHLVRMRSLAWAESMATIAFQVPVCCVWVGCFYFLFLLLF